MIDETIRIDPQSFCAQVVFGHWIYPGEKNLINMVSKHQIHRYTYRRCSITNYGYNSFIASYGLCTTKMILIFLLAGELQMFTESS